MANENVDSLIYAPNGKINAPFILANANLLMKAGELKHAESLFNLSTRHSTLGYCGHYGLGQCAVLRNQFDAAVQHFEKALSLSKSPFIAIALLDALYKLREFNEGEKLCLKFAKEFSGDTVSTEKFRALYSKFANQVDEAP